MYELRSKKILISGASKGLGLVGARAFVLPGVKIGDGAIVGGFCRKS